MKVTVEIPDGKYCGGDGKQCLFFTDTDPDYSYCSYLDAVVEYAEPYDIIRRIKHPECPSLKEKEDARIK